MSNHDLLLSFLQQKGLIDEIPDLQPFSGRNLHPLALLESMGLLEEEHAINLLADSFDIEILDLVSGNENDQFTISEYVPIVERTVLWKNKMLPLFARGDKVVTAFANPLDEDAKKGLEFSLSRKIEAVLAKEEEIVRLLERYFPLSATQEEPEVLQEAAPEEEEI